MELEKLYVKIKEQLLYAKKLEDSNFKVIDLFNRIDDIKKYNRKWQGICYLPRYTLEIGADGNIYPCCIYKYNSEYIMGNIYNNSINEIIDSNVYNQVYNKLTSDKCLPCFFDEQNNIIHYLLYPKTEHDFFI